MRVTDPEFQSHAVFGELDQLAAFYKQLAFHVFPWVSRGTTDPWNIDSYVFSSIQGTLESMCGVLRNGRINDAYALLRKYFDAAVINIYGSLYIEENWSIENFVIKELDGWRKGTVQLPKVSDMIRFIGKSPRVDWLIRVLDDQRYKRLRARCNAHTHYNFFYHVLQNDNEIANKRRLQALDRFLNDVRDAVTLHVAYLFVLNPQYMMSSDHVDFLECGMKPPEGSELWVAQFIQELFDEVVSNHRPDVYEAIKRSSSMHLT